MSWEQGNNNIKRIPNVTEDLLSLKGELTDEQARATLAQFLYHNPAFMADLIGGIKIYPFQEMLIKGWMQNDYNLAVLGRGLSKSWTVALFAVLWAIYNPNNRIVIVSFAFRASRRILEQCEKFVNDNNADLLKACFPQDLRRGTDEWKWTLPNKSTIQSLPLGDGTKIRGIRADTLIVDEFAYLPEGVISEILQPFLVANNKIKEQRETQEQEDALIAAGVMTEAERTKNEENIKVIFLSSACYQFEHMYKRYNEWIENIRSQKEKGVSYFVARMGYGAAPDGLVNRKVIEEAKSTTSEAVFDREYNAIFTPDSGGFFRASKMQACTIPDGDAPTLEIMGERGAEYIVSIDTALSGAEDSDHFAMCVLKIVIKGDGTKVPMLVHSYAVAGGDLKEHILYFYYILKNFNVVYIATDASQGDNVEFLNASIQSKRFKDAKIDLCDIDANFKGNDFRAIPAEVKRSYNKTIGRIIQKQPFSSDWQRAANEYLQGAFDHRMVLFAAKIAPNPAALSRIMNIDISMLKEHKEFKDMSIMDFIENQDNLVDLTKKECSMIISRTTELGTMQYGLPQNVKRSGGPNRMRKDSYSALLLGVWAFKIYQESQYVEVQTGMQDFPYSLI